MERLTKRQKEVFDAINAGNMSMSKISRAVKVSREAINQRIHQMIAKGYLQKDGKGLYSPTPEGLDAIIKDGGKTKHSYYDKREIWEKTLRPDGFSKEVEATIQPK